jgi:hypothetical protein
VSLACFKTETPQRRCRWHVLKLKHPIARVADLPSNTIIFANLFLQRGDEDASIEKIDIRKEENRTPGNSVSRISGCLNGELF